MPVINFLSCLKHIPIIMYDGLQCYLCHNSRSQYTCEWQIYFLLAIMQERGFGN